MSSEPRPTDDSNVEEIEHDDLCPICRYLIHRPVVTQCKHTLCEMCMAEWADISLTSQMQIVPLDDEAEDFNAVALEARCPMCRTSTTAKRSAEKEEYLKSKYPDMYAEREAEAAKDEADKDVSIETITLYIGNTDVVAPSTASDGTVLHDWTFFVKSSNTTIINEVEILLHPTFKQNRIVKRRAPYTVRREGWGTFTINVNVILKTGYSWISSDAVDTRYAKRTSLPLQWTLSFENGGGQARCRLKVKNERRKLRAT